MAPLAALLGDEKLSHMARYALEPIPGADVDNALREAVGKLNGRPLVDRCHRAASAVQARRSSRSICLPAQLKDQDADVVQAAARALGSLGTAATADSKAL